MARLSKTQRSLLRGAGYVAAVLLVFVSAAWASLDADRLRVKAIDALDDRFDVTIASVEKGWLPGRFSIYGMVLTTRPDKPGDKPTVIAVDELHASVGLLGLLRGAVGVDVEAQLGAGTVDGRVVWSKDGLDVDVDTSQLDLAALPSADAVFAGLPATGGLNAHVSLHVPRGERGLAFDQASGRAELSCPMCTVGPGKVVPRTQSSGRASAFAKEGVTLPKLNLGDNKVVLTVDNGRADIDTFEAVSTDGELYAEGYILLKSPFARSEIHHCYRFKFSDQAKKKNAKLEGIERSMELARRADGYIGMRMTGTFDRPRRIGSRSCVPGETPADIRRKRAVERRRRARQREGERPAVGAEAPVRRPPGDIAVRPAATDGVSPEAVTARPIHVDDARPASQPIEMPPPRTSGPQLSAPADRIKRAPDDVREGDDGEGDGDGAGGDEAAGDDHAEAEEDTSGDGETAADEGGEGDGDHDGDNAAGEHTDDDE
ncbi:MAG: type II secretion system protein GspN [Deltaproteobacteria bacterium]|nr:MAG: type II secretion system protein GspN [Deltaproteobacteria bacterium]